MVYFWHFYYFDLCETEFNRTLQVCQKFSLSMYSKFIFIPYDPTHVIKWMCKQRMKHIRPKKKYKKNWNCKIVIHWKLPFLDYLLSKVLKKKQYTVCNIKRLGVASHMWDLSSQAKSKLITSANENKHLSEAVKKKYIVIVVCCQKQFTLIETKCFNVF